jgi:hypothetical protein
MFTIFFGFLRRAIKVLWIIVRQRDPGRSTCDKRTVFVSM